MVAAEIAALVSTGATLAGTTTQALTAGMSYNVACGIEIENRTKWPLRSPTTIPHGGYVKEPAVTVQPGYREAMLTHKRGHTATGTYGTVSWQVRAATRFYIMLMWSVPYNQNHYSNWMGIGITTSQHRAGNWELFDAMYYGRETDFRRSEYYYQVRTLSYSNAYVRVDGWMGTSHKPTLKLIVSPVSEADYAPAIKEALGI